MNNSFGKKGFCLFLICSVVALLLPSCKENAPQSSLGTMREEGVLRLMSYNIRSGKGMDDQYDLNRIAAVINREMPDVVAVQEVDKNTVRSGKIDTIGELGVKTDMKDCGFAKAIDYQGGEYGIGYLARENPGSVKIQSLPGREEERRLIIVDFPEYAVLATHFSLNKEDQMTSLDIVIKEAEQFDKPVFLMGDLNFRPDSPQMEKLKERFTVLTDTRQKTFPSPEPRVCIDYIAQFKNNAPGVEVLDRVVIDEPMASDHRPVQVDIRLIKNI